MIGRAAAVAPSPPRSPRRTVRVIAWTVIMALALFQAYAQRYAVSPDGVSYLDLSDGVVTGHWSRLVSLYWSPLYPVLIGLARRVAGAGAAAEVPIVHAVNLLCFAGLLAAFEYFLFAVLDIARSVRRSVVATPCGIAGAYAFFACVALTMTPLELTTPDALSGAAAFLALGALLRLHGGAHPPRRSRRDATILGLALGVGALAKSFLVPWGIVCLVVLAIAMRRRRAGITVHAAAIWLVIVAPWSALLSHRAHRLTFGDTGRLTYVWYVNGEYPPSVGGVPPGARTPDADALLPGVGLTPDASGTGGTDPMWFNPARWNTDLSPHLDVGDQIGVLNVFRHFYLRNLTPVLLLVFLIAVAPAGSRRGAWRLGWVVFVPAVAGLGGYALVIVTARYIMPFIMAGAVVLVAVLPAPQRMRPWLVFVGLLLPVALESLTADTRLALATVASVIGGMLAGVLVPSRRAVWWGIAVVAALAVTRVVLPPALPDVLYAGALGLVLVFSWLSYRAARAGRSVHFARDAERSFWLLLVALLAFRAVLRFDADTTAFNRAARFGNVSWKIANELAAHGITPGTRIALIGPHAESYWARTARLHIVGNVPAPLVQAFWQRPAVVQDSLLAQFAGVGAAVAITEIGPRSGAPDSTWRPVKYHGWIRPLVPAASIAPTAR